MKTETIEFDQTLYLPNKGSLKVVVCKEKEVSNSGNDSIYGSVKIVLQPDFGPGSVILELEALNSASLKELGTILISAAVSLETIEKEYEV
jgi:hypothetical protein